MPIDFNTGTQALKDVFSPIGAAVSGAASLIGGLGSGIKGGAEALVDTGSKLANEANTARNRLGLTAGDSFNRKQFESGLRDSKQMADANMTQMLQGGQNSVNMSNMSANITQKEALASGKAEIADQFAKQVKADLDHQGSGQF